MASFKNGLKKLDDKFVVQIRVNNKMLYRTFSIKEFGSLEKAEEEANHFILSRKSLREQISNTGIKHVYEKKIKVKGKTYLYLRLIKKEIKIAICIGKIENNDDLEKLRRSKKYKNALSKLSGLSVERKEI